MSVLPPNTPTGYPSNGSTGPQFSIRDVRAMNKPKADDKSKPDSTVPKTKKVSARIFLILGLTIAVVAAFVFAPISAVVKTGLFCGTLVALYLIGNSGKRNFPDDDNFLYKMTKPKTADDPII